MAKRLRAPVAIDDDDDDVAVITGSRRTLLPAPSPPQSSSRAASPGGGVGVGGDGGVGLRAAILELLERGRGPRSEPWTSAALRRALRPASLEDIGAVLTALMTESRVSGCLEAISRNRCSVLCRGRGFFKCVIAQIRCSPIHHHFSSHRLRSCARAVLAAAREQTRRRSTLLRRSVRRSWQG